MKVPDLSALAVPGSRIAVRVTPKAAMSRIVVTEDADIRVYVTAPAEDGKANAAATRLLAKALGVAKSRLTLVLGTMSRDKVFRVA
ncbi:DUF167 domain-containing protein [Roseivivax sp. CAU 1753]